MKIRSIFTFLFVILNISFLFAQDIPLSFGDKSLDFAEKCFVNKDYIQASYEYKRFAYFFPNHPKAKEALYKSAISLFYAGDFKKSASEFENIIEKYPQTKLSDRSYFMISRCMSKQKMPVNAIINIENLIKTAKEAETLDKAYYYAGALYIDIEDLQKAKYYFKKISDPNKEKFNIRIIEKELNKADYIHQKNPTAAGLLSIIPGAGQLYCKRYQDAIVAFLLNTALIIAAAEAFDNDMPALGASIAVIETGFFAGNIYGAVTDAHKYNKDRKSGFIESLKEKIDLSLNIADNKGLEMFLSLRFDY